MTSTIRAWALMVLAVLIASTTAGCSPSKPRILAGSVSPQESGSVTYLSGVGGSSIVTSGSAERIGTFPIKHGLDARPHLTYVVFRSTVSQTDTVASIDAVGDYVETAGSFSMTQSFRPGDNVKIVSVDRVEQVEARVVAKSVDLIRVSPAEGLPDVSVSSDRTMTIHRGWFAFSDHIELEEIDAIDLSRPAFLGNASLTITKADGGTAVVTGADSDTWVSAYEQLRRVVIAVAPHVKCSSHQNYWPVIILVVVVVMVVVGIVAARSSS